MLKLFRLWRSRKRLIVIAYLVIGLIVAQRHDYLAHIGTVKALLSAVLAVGLWPLVLLGIDVHLR